MCNVILYVDSDYESEFVNHIHKVINFMYPRVSGGIGDITVEVSTDYDIDPSVCTGFCTPEVADGTPDTFEIELAPSIDLDTLTKTLIHEMIHVGQYLRGDLVQGHNSHDGLFEINWKGITHTGIQYTSRPWEIEADELESQMYEEYKELN